MPEEIDKYAVTRGEIVFRWIMAAYFLTVITLWVCAP